jgi:hypothetical protein
VRHPSACSASLCVSDRLTRRRGGAERGSERKRVPRTTRQTRTGVNVSENRYNPLSRASRRAEALGYGMRSPPARARADYFFKNHKPSALQDKARLRGTRTPMITLSPIGYRLSAIDYRLSIIGYRLSAIDYRLSIIGYRLSAIGYRLCKAKLPLRTVANATPPAAAPRGRAPGRCDSSAI